MIPLGLEGVREVALLAAHCDDLAIGLGGTLLTLRKNRPDIRVRALVLGGAGTPREAEEREALSALAGEVDLTILDVPDGRAPAHWDRIKDAMGQFARGGDADLVFAPHRGDAHQDHRLVAELAPTEFRDHLILGYEILKWETDTPQPTVLHPLDPAVADEKLRILMGSYPSQQSKDWYDEGAFRALLRLRGVQCHHEHAEAFVLEKAVLTLTTPHRTGAR
ncbi:PIG-L deacetylase family protein [Aeromicrobium wangtongii]|uniref:PIG-L family deacetylase n=1 Tax=Aeromicrobium wangtongii TaxID=2969247 RepID=A0ABY5M494_9ACTN|nr:PIG-L family deacetylase [Aeromicrobium wangtongii]MCD9198966.1 PIG-L family deacetylase [Aeromicrobium wangtongii]UUP12998.1 PIG-L family deacetylase [Aeromicrobium wangtongii]